MGVTPEVDRTEDFILPLTLVYFLACKNGVPPNFFRDVIAFLFPWSLFSKLFPEGLTAHLPRSSMGPRFQLQEVTGEHIITFHCY